MSNQDKEMKAEISKLRSAQSQGLLVPLLKYLEDRYRATSKPMKVEGSEWPLKRAYQDGAADSYLSVLTWLNGRINPSPDGAQNTEDEHGKL